ncbi:glycosyltransferase family 39 protein [Streptomyces canus]|uniref:ArnT family glycosyltransferase n=1 Tax=Streptomyces canus TaxID=58343 RepID=UPI0003724CE6|nr:glycosyltransferase family 39 protein [Streptomyces canus]
MAGIVRAWAGPFAALIAALTLTFTPITVALNRATIPDTALTLLLVAAAGALQKAVRTGRLLPLITCGVWVGLAFQTKMLQAWLVLPVFAVVHQLAASGSPLRRAWRLLVSGAVTLAVSCSWALIAWVTPAGNRPYVDATSNNNPFSLVFGYNGISRFTDDGTAFGAVAATAASRISGNTGRGMLVNPTVGPQIAWFLPLAVLAVYAMVFSVSNGNHVYYTAELPAGPAPRRPTSRTHRSSPCGVDGARLGCVTRGAAVLTVRQPHSPDGCHLRLNSSSHSAGVGRTVVGCAESGPATRLET